MMSPLNAKKVKTFKSLLSGLTCEKHKTGHLTQQARADLTYQETLAEVDVNAIISFIVNKAADDRLAGLYLIDSICQNVGGKFVPLFEEHLFGIIETTYRYGSSSTRYIYKKNKKDYFLICFPNILALDCLISISCI